MLRQFVPHHNLMKMYVSGTGEKNLGQGIGSGHLDIRIIHFSLSEILFERLLEKKLK